MSIGRTRTRLKVMQLAVAATLVYGVAACGGDDAELPEPAPPRDSTEPTQGPELTAEEQQAVEEVKALVDEFLTVYVDIVTAGDPGTDSVYARFPRGFPIQHVNNEIVYNYLEERRVDGHLAWELIDVIEVDMEHVAEFRDGERIVPRVRLRYCVDATDWQTVDKTAGEPVEPGEHRLMDPFGERYMVAVRASYYDPDPIGSNENPYWQIEEWDNQRDQPC